MQEFFDLVMLPQNLLFYFFAYALAATPTSYLVARFIHGVDVKKEPLKLHSAFYVWRTMSRKSGVLVFVLDALKGIIPCAIAHSLLVSPVIIAFIGLFAVIGHCFSIWLNFSGGRGAATAMGALLFVYWPASLFGILVFALLMMVGFGAGRSSLVGVSVGLGVLFLGVSNKMIWLIVAIMGVIILARHRAFWNDSGK